MDTCKHQVKCQYCKPDMPGILSDTSDGRACHCARYGTVGKQYCCQQVIVGNVCYDHAKKCDRCEQPYDPATKHKCVIKPIVFPNLDWQGIDVAKTWPEGIVVLERSTNAGVTTHTIDNYFRPDWLEKWRDDSIDQSWVIIADAMQKE